jgi:UDP-N-acetylglucosamine transferase subunit ALG13
MIFVTVGTHHQSFARLVDAMDAIAGDTKEHVVIQRGLTKAVPQFAQSFEFKPRDDLLHRYDGARVIVTHAGIGSIIDALKAGKPLIVVPRLKKFGEHNTDHQIELARAVERRGWGRVVIDIGALAEACANPPPAFEGYAPAKEALVAFVVGVVAQATDGAG